MSETITAPMTSLTFEAVNQINSDPVMLVAFALTWFVPLFMYFIIGATVRGRSTSGRVMSKPMISFPNFWYGVIIFGVFQLILVILLVFPVWLRLID